MRIYFHQPLAELCQDFKLKADWAVNLRPLLAVSASQGWPTNCTLETVCDPIWFSVPRF